MNTQTLHLDLTEAIGWLKQRASEYPSDPITKDIPHIIKRLEFQSPRGSNVVSYNKANLILNEYLSGKLTPNFNKIIFRVREDWRRSKFHSTIYGVRL